MSVACAFTVPWKPAFLLRENPWNITWIIRETGCGQWENSGAE
jgi:hypothetical protein